MPATAAHAAAAAAPATGDYEPRSLKVLRPDGAYVSIANSGWMNKYGVARGWALVMFNLAKG